MIVEAGIGYIAHKKIQELNRLREIKKNKKKGKFSDGLDVDPFVKRIAEGYFGGKTFDDYDRLLLIDSMNLFGSFSVGYICYIKKVWQAMLLEVIWFGIATYSFINNIINDENQE